MPNHVECWKLYFCIIVSPFLLVVGLLLFVSHRENARALSGL